MILLGIGGNLPSPMGLPPATFASALSALEFAGVRVVGKSSLYVSPPWPAQTGPEFFNQVVIVETRLPPGRLLQVILGIEQQHGRVRREKWGTRTLDLDILDYNGLITDSDFLALPHPWVEERAFVLKPIVEVAPFWRHPVTCRTAKEAISALGSVEAEAPRLFHPG
jgi:2-amino-4-hydroxy-6-hydroxymethyldihydropteridine diphosphokinase